MVSGVARFAFTAGALSCAAFATEIHREMYTTNAICRKQHCINPIFPGLEDLHQIEHESQHQCYPLEKVSDHLSFCRGAVNYDPGLRVQTGTLSELVKYQDNEALTMFVYHLAGMGKEAWEHPEPAWSPDPCVKAVWRMVCYTYFPRAEVGCQEGSATAYLRPCQSSCWNYINHCGVECCDESVQCVFTHTKQLGTTSITTSGYINHDGPSSLCTGAGSRSTSPAAILLGALLILPALQTVGASLSFSRPTFGRGSFLVALVFVALSMQGCMSDALSGNVKTHRVGNWRGEADYLVVYEYLPPSTDPRLAVMNSCSVSGLTTGEYCSGNGNCDLWDRTSTTSRLTFCRCNPGWADPECGTPRLSQATAFCYSLFLGMFGADQFYLGFPLTGAVKALTLGGGGIWWIVDFVRIGSAPVYSFKYRVAADLPHWVFVLSVLLFMQIVGWIFAYITVHRAKVREYAVAVRRQYMLDKQSTDDMPIYQSVLQARKDKSQRQSNRAQKDMYLGNRDLKRNDMPGYGAASTQGMP